MAMAREHDFDKSQVEINQQRNTSQYYTPQLIKMGSFHAGGKTFGLAEDSVRERLVVRRQDTTAPITVYDFQGHQLQMLGQEVDGITGYNQSIAIDSKRDLYMYMIPMGDGSLVIMDMKGTVRDRIKVCDRSLHGVSYSDQDMYITSSIDTHQVYVINPNTKLICTDFNCTTTFWNPIHVGSGQYDTGDGTKPVIWANYEYILPDTITNRLDTYTHLFVIIPVPTGKIRTHLSVITPRYRPFYESNTNRQNSELLIILYSQPIRQSRN